MWWSLKYWGLEQAYNYVVYTDNPFWRAHKVYELLLGKQSHTKFEIKDKANQITGADKIVEGNLLSLNTVQTSSKQTSPSESAKSRKEAYSKLLTNSKIERGISGSHDWIMSKTDRIYYKNPNNKLLSWFHDLPRNSHIETLIVGWTEYVHSQHRHYNGHPLIQKYSNPPRGESAGFMNVPDLEGFADFARKQVLGQKEELSNKAGSLQPSSVSNLDRSHRRPKLVILQKPECIGHVR